MVAHLRMGGVVATNVELVWPAIKEYSAELFNVVLEDDQFIGLSEEQIGLFHHHTPSGSPELPVLVVIDEAHLTFNARDFAKTDKNYRETLVFLTQSRKVHTDVIFISQSVLNMDKQFMRLVQFIWRFRDLARWKIPGLGIKYPLKQILAVQFDYDGKTVLQRSFVRKDPRIFALYRTNSLVRPFPRLEGVTTSRKLKRAAGTQKQMVKYLIIGGIIVGVFCAFLLYKKLTAIGNPSGDAIKGTVAAAVGPPVTDKTLEGTTAPEPKIVSAEAAYEIYDEDFQAWHGPERTLKTSSGWYQLGEMSNKGFVMAVSERRAKIGTPSGRTAWVLATKDYRAPAVVATPAPAAPQSTSSPTPIPAASPLPSTSSWK
jgi:hypothetical protein